MRLSLNEIAVASDLVRSSPPISLILLIFEFNINSTYHQINSMRDADSNAPNYRYLQPITAGLIFLNLIF